jgi:hypothetical protein
MKQQARSIAKASHNEKEWRDVVEDRVKYKIKEHKWDAEKDKQRGEEERIEKQADKLWTMHFDKHGF